MSLIAEICFSKSWGGLEQRCAEDTIGLSQRGHRVIPVINPTTPLQEHFLKVDIDPVTIKAVDYIDPIAVVKLTKLFKQYHVHAVHIHRTQDMMTVLAAADFAGVEKRVLTLRMESKRRKKDLYHRWAYSRLTTVLTITKRIASLVKQNAAVNPNKVQVLYNGYALDKLQAEAEAPEVIRSRWHIPSNAFVIGIVGRLEAGKGQHHLIAAGQLLLQKIPDLYLMIAGDETVNMPGELARLKKMAAGMGLIDRVVFTGYQNPPGIIVPAFDVSVLASKKETFGGVIAEAMALGVPVTATDAGGVPEIIEHGVNGLLTKPEDPPALAQAILQLFENHELRRRFAVAGTDKLRSKFSLESHLVGLEKVLT